MYSEVITKIDDLTFIRSFIQDCPYGLLLSVEWEKIHDLHTPFVLSDDGRLIGYISKSNPQWKGWKIGNKVKVIFKDTFNQRYSEWNYNALSISGYIETVEQESEALKYLTKLMAAVRACDGFGAQNNDQERAMQLLSEFIVFSISIDSEDLSFELKQSKIDAVINQQSIATP